MRGRSGFIVMLVLLGFLAAAPPVTPAEQDNSGFLYGYVTTKLGDAYEGFLRWGTEESFWDDLFNATKEHRPYVEPDKGDAPGVQADPSSLPVARWKVLFGYEARQYHTVFIARFGDIATIDVDGDDRALLQMKSGETHEVSGGSNDVNGSMYIQDIEVGDIEVEWRHIERIEFMQAPANLPPKARRLYGVVATTSDRFEGYVLWDNQECLSTDILNAASDDGGVAIAMGEIRSIERSSGESCEVVLEDGRELSLFGTNDVNNRNRGIIVEDVRFGRISIPWAEFDYVQFSEAPGSGNGYDQFGGGGILQGTVTDIDGKTYAGEIVYDFDETRGWEMLDGWHNELRFEIPFMNVVSVTRAGSAASIVVLRSGEEVELTEGKDVTDRNDGVLVVRADDWENPLLVEWQRVAHIEFERW